MEIWSNIEILHQKLHNSPNIVKFVLNRQPKTMKRLSAILTIAALVLLFHVAHISVCYSADNAADPNIEAMAESGSDMIVPTVASQAVAPVADSSNALIIRIPIPESKAIIIGVIIFICLALAAIYIRRHYKARNTAARESKQTHVLMAHDHAATEVRQDIAASTPTEVTCRQVLQTKMSDSTPCETTAEQQTKIASNVVGQSQETSATSMPASANASNSEHLNGGGRALSTQSQTRKRERVHIYRVHQTWCPKIRSRILRPPDQTSA